MHIYTHAIAGSLHIYSESHIHIHAYNGVLYSENIESHTSTYTYSEISNTVSSHDDLTVNE